MQSKERAEFHDIQFKMFNPKCKGKRRGINKKRGEEREEKGRREKFLEPTHLNFVVKYDL